MSTHRRVAIITGGATGVGAAVARMRAAKAYNVLINYSRSGGTAAGMVKDCLALGVDAIAVHGDVASDGDCRELARQAMARWGRSTGLAMDLLRAGRCCHGNRLKR